MIICAKAEVIGGYFVKNPIIFTLNDVSITLSSSNEKNYIEAANYRDGSSDYFEIID